MNHARITEQALRYRNHMVADSYTAGRFDPRDVAEIAIECADPAIDTAIRQIATAWVDGGLQLERLVQEWQGDDVDTIFKENAALLDAIDDIMKAVHRAQFTRPRRRETSQNPRRIRF